MSCREVNTNIVIGGQKLGTFNYTFRDIVESGVDIEDIGIVAFTCLIFGNGRQKQWYGELLEMFNNNPDKMVREGIQEIRDDIVQTNPNIDVQTELTEEYYVLTAAGAVVDSQGNVVKKIRNLSILPLLASQVNLLSQQGFDLTRTATMDVTSFIDMFEDPIRMNGQPVNDKAVTLFAEGGSSQTNAGVFDARINTQDAPAPFPDINREPLNSEFQGRIETFVDEDGHISTGIRDGGEGTLRVSSNNIVAPAGQTNLGAVLPLGILLLLSGQLG